MKTSHVASLVAICGLIACSSPEPRPSPLYESSKEVSTVATVEAVDVDARKITLKGPEGNTITCDVDERVRNLSQVKPGDVVTLTYIEAAAIHVVKKAEHEEDDVVIDRAPEGSKPGGKVTRQVSRTAEIVSVDQSRGTVTLRASDDSVTTVHVRRPERLAGLKVGDLLRITYTEAVAVSVQPASSEVR
jgi:hypothetical protein